MKTSKTDKISILGDEIKLGPDQVSSSTKSSSIKTIIKSVRRVSKSGAFERKKETAQNYVGFES
jgi:hypothetical protein